MGRSDPSSSPARGLEDLLTAYGLPEEAGEHLAAFSHLLATDALAPTAVRDPTRILEDHLADSLVALALRCVRSATIAVDIGSGAGLPGLPLAVALPQCWFALLESSARKCSFLERAVEASSVKNAEVVQARAETWQPGLGRADLALVRAVAPLDVVLEYAAPLLKVGGWLVAWRGARNPEAEVEGEVAAELLGMRAEQIYPTTPYSGARHRHLHLFSKVMETPSRFPRRPGMAAKRPLGARGRATAG